MHRWNFEFTFIYYITFNNNKETATIWVQISNSVGIKMTLRLVNP